MRRIALLTPFALILTVACGSSGSPSPKAEFSILPSPATTTIIQGQSGTVQVTASRLNGETGAIALTLSGPPAGVTGSGSIAGGGTSATFTVQVAGTVAAGTYPLTIQASDGTLTHTAALSLTVESVTASHWQFDAPVAFFAVQDGTGAWTPVSGSGGVYAFTLNQAKGAVAYVLEDTGAGTSDVVVTYGTALDLGSRDLRTVPAPLTASGTFTGLGATDTVDLYLGLEGYDHEQGAGTGIWSMANLTVGTHDLLAVQSDFNGVPTAFLAHRGLSLQASGDLGGPGQIDFSSGAASLVAGTLNVTGASLATGELMDGLETFETADGSASLAGTGMTLTSSMPIYGVPAGSLAATDRHAFLVRVGPDDGNGAIDAGNNRAAWYLKASGATLAVPAPVAMTLPSTTVAATSPYARLRTQWTFTAAHNESFSALMKQGAARTWSWSSTAGYGAVDITLPDFSTLAGWKNAWGFAPGTAVTQKFFAYGRTWAAWPPADGAQSNLAYRTVSVTP